MHQLQSSRPQQQSSRPQVHSNLPDMLPLVRTADMAKPGQQPSQSMKGIGLLCRRQG